MLRNGAVVLFVMFPYLYIAYQSTFDRSNCAIVLEAFTRTTLQQQEQQHRQQQQQQQLQQEQQLQQQELQEEQQKHRQLSEESFTTAISSLQALKSDLSSSVEKISSIQLPSCPPALPATVAPVGVGCRLALGLQTQKQTDFVSFEQVLDASTSDKRQHRFGHMYAEYFDPIKYDKVAFLEIGLRGGDSIALWRNFFPNARIYGLDKGQFFQGFRSHAGDENVKIFVGDQANATFLRQMKEVIRREVGSLDFLIDDGGHTMRQQQTSLIELLPIVKPGGYYFIEDLETSYYEKGSYGCYGQPCGGGPPGKRGTTIAVLKSMIDVLNEDFIPGPNPKRKVGVYRHKVIEGDHLVGSVQCWRNMCVLRRKKKNSYF